MSPLLSASLKFAFVSTFLAQTALSQYSCLSFGVDYQSDGSYFQNSLSTDDFTFVSKFEGCQKDVANNILVDPSGNEVQCSDTNLQPDDTPELSTCPIEKANLVTGPWSIIIISNNGNGTPIAYERDFSLTVGPQQTSTYTPTVTLSATITPVINATTISTFTSTTVLTPLTVTKPSKVFHPTTTSTPKPVTITSTDVLATITIRAWTLDVKQVMQTVTATCVTPKKQKKADPKATITPTLVHAAALETGSKLRPRGRVSDRAVSLNREERIRDRKERLGLIKKRAPDAPTVIVTDMNTSDYVTITSTSTAPATTVTVVSISTTTTTSTPPPVTVFNGISTAMQVTITAPAITKTKTRYTIDRVFTTITYEETVTIRTTITPSAWLAACTEAGGSMHHHHQPTHPGNPWEWSNRGGKGKPRHHNGENGGNDENNWTT